MVQEPSNPDPFPANTHLNSQGSIQHMLPLKAQSVTQTHSHHVLSGSHFYGWVNQSPHDSIAPPWASNPRRFGYESYALTVLEMSCIMLLDRMKWVSSEMRNDSSEIWIISDQERQMQGCFQDRNHRATRHHISRSARKWWVCLITIFALIHLIFIVSLHWWFRPNMAD